MRISFPASPRIAELTTGGYSPRAAAIIKQIPGIVRAHGSNRYLMGRDAAELFAEQWAAAGLRGDFERADPLAYAPAGSAHLRDYQREAVGFLLGERQCILADSMGLGKTRSAIEALKLSGIARALVVAPSYVVGVWENELRKWSLDVEKECYVLGGKTRLTVRAANTKPARGDGVRDLPERGLCVIGYDVLAAWSERLAAWAPEACVFDEAHYLMSSFSKRTKAASAVCHAADYRWALTGTPLTNRPRDLWSLCEVIRPSGFGSFFNFCSRYCNAHQEQVTPLRVVWNFDGRSNLEELNRRLRHFMLRRTARDVALQLPPKTRQIIKVPVKSAKIIDGEMSAAAMRASLNVAADAKLPIAASHAIESARAGSRVVVFCYRRSVAEGIVDAARAAGVPCSLVHGGVSHANRGVAIAAARTCETGHILAATIDSSATGIDLSYADVCMFVELTWEPHELLQAEARLHRYGQQSPVLVQYLLTEGTADDLIAQVVISRLDQFETAIGTTGESLAAELAGDTDAILSELSAALHAMGEGE